MKHLLLPLLFIALGATFNSCNTENDPNLVQPLLGTYTGAMNIGEPSFQSSSYSVVVSDVSSEVVKITPSGSMGSEWTAHITNIAGVYTCISCVSQNQVTFTKINGVYNLSYNYDSNNEQFSGQKQ